MYNYESESEATKRVGSRGEKASNTLFTSEDQQIINFAPRIHNLLWAHLSLSTSLEFRRFHNRDKASSVTDVELSLGQQSCVKCDMRESRLGRTCVFVQGGNWSANHETVGLLGNRL